MGSQAGGNVRFRGPGSLWKSSWKGRPLYSEVCCITGFAADTEGQFYENDDGPLNITPALGWFLGALPIVEEVPAAPVVIARNGGVATEGWVLSMFDDSISAGEPAVGFTFTVFDGAGVAATVSVGGVLLRNLDQIGGAIAVPLIAAIEPPSGGFPNGRAILAVTGGTSVAALGTPYLNTDPTLLVGTDGTSPFVEPNCISGLVGGTAPWTAADGQTEVAATLVAWGPLLQAANQVVEVPNTAQAGLVNTNGWRIDANTSPFTIAPNPLPDFVDAEPLDYGNTLPDARDLSVGCLSPFVLYPANIQFPYA